MIEFARTADEITTTNGNREHWVTIFRVPDTRPSARHHPRVGFSLISLRLPSGYALGMNSRRRLSPSLALAALAAAALLPCSAVAASGLPGHAVPSGLHAVEGKAGGRIVEGPLSKASSPDAAFRTGLARVRHYFDRAPHVIGAVRSNDRTLTLALFKATLGGTPVGGYILTTYVAHGPSHLDVLFDRVDRASRTVNPMLAQVSALHPSPGVATSSGGSAEPLHDVVSQDGTVHAQLPAGWHTTLFGQGQMAAVGPNRAEVDQEVSLQFLDPNGSLARSQQQLQSSMRNPLPGQGIVVPYTSDVRQAYYNALSALIRRGIVPPTQVTIEHARAYPPNSDGSNTAELIGTSVKNGRTDRFDGQVLVSPLNPYGGWTLSIKMISSSKDTFEHDMPTLLAIFNSYNVDQHRRDQQVALSIQGNQEGMARGNAMMAATRAQMLATFNASMDHARSVQSGIDRSTSGFVHYLNDTTVVENSSGGRSSADAGFAQSVVANDPQNFRIVPVSEYRSGD